MGDYLGISKSDDDTIETYETYETYGKKCTISVNFSIFAPCENVRTLHSTLFKLCDLLTCGNILAVKNISASQITYSTQFACDTLNVTATIDAAIFFDITQSSESIKNIYVRSSSK